MRWSAPLVVAVCSLGFSTAAMAQTGPQLPLVGTPPNPTSTSTFGPTESHWIASGFVGSNVGGGANDASHTFGGELAYLWRGVVGVEGLVDVAPEFKFDSALLASDPHVFTYMGNAIVVMPIGTKGWIQPYGSLGLGGIQLRSSVFTIGPTPTALATANGAAVGTTSGNEIRVGGNYGAGLMGFSGRFGVRADIRYYKATSDNSLVEPTATPLAATATVDRFTQTLISDLDFWRANIGVVFKW